MPKAGSLQPNPPHPVARLGLLLLADFANPLTAHYKDTIHNQKSETKRLNLSAACILPYHTVPTPEMADPVSAIASVLTVAETAAAGARCLWAFLNDLRTAPKQLQALKEDVLSAQHVLDGFRPLFEGETEYPSPMTLILHRFGLVDAINVNKRIILDFTATIEKYTTHSKTGDLSKRDRLKVTFRKSKLEAFKARLNASKNTISYAVTGAIL